MPSAGGRCGCGRARWRGSRDTTSCQCRDTRVYKEPAAGRSRHNSPSRVRHEKLAFCFVRNAQESVPSSREERPAPCFANEMFPALWRTLSAILLIGLVVGGPDQASFPAAGSARPDVGREKGKVFESRSSALIFPGGSRNYVAAVE